MYKTTVGINGFGRFSQHLLKYWVENYDNACFEIVNINEDTLEQKQLESILKKDIFLGSFYEYVTFYRDSIDLLIGRTVKKIRITHVPFSKIAWFNEVDFFLECSGKVKHRSEFNLCKHAVKRIVISSSFKDADQTIIMGLNEQDISPTSKIISYGSCTVNAYIPLANQIHSYYTILDSDFSVVHNTPQYIIDRGAIHPAIKSCTLQWSGISLLKFLNEHNFHVSYITIPYTGVSLITYRFRLKDKLEKVSELLDLFDKDVVLSKYYKLHNFDIPLHTAKFTKYNAELLANSIQIRGNNLYINGYLDNENSVNRYFDLVNILPVIHK